MKQINTDFKPRNGRMLTYFRFCTWLTGILWIGLTPVVAQNLNLDWGISTRGKGTTSVLDNTVRGVAYDQDHNVYIAGTFHDTMDFDPGPGDALLFSTDLNGNPVRSNYFIAKYDEAGNYIWAKNIRGTNAVFVQGDLIRIDSNGDIIVKGEFSDSSDFDLGSGLSILAPDGSNTETFLAKYDEAGNYIWAKSLTGSESSYVGGIAVDISDNIYVSGSFTDTIYFSQGVSSSMLVSSGAKDNYVAKFDNDGNYLWAHRMGSFQSGQEDGRGLTVDEQGNVISTGFFADSATFSSATTILMGQPGMPNAYLVKHDSTGNFLWAFNIPSLGGYTSGQNVTVDKEGNIYAVGMMMGVCDFDPGPDTAMLYPNALTDAYLAKYDSEGNYLWAFNVGGSIINMFEVARTDNIGNVYVCGNISGTADFDPGTDTANLIATGYGNAVVAKYDSAGNYLWAGSFESSSAQGSLGTVLDVTNSGTVYAGGYFQSSVDLNPGSGTENRTSVDYDIFLVKLSCESTDSTYLNEVICDSSYTLNGEVYTSSGMYIQHLSNTTHCDSMIVLDLTIQPMDPPVITINGFILGVTNTYATYQWIKDGVPMPGETNSTLNVTENADYQVEVTNEDGCAAISDIYTVNNVGIEDVNGIGQQISIYPNPTSDLITLKSPVQVYVDLFSAEGKFILHVERASTISLKGLADGVYILRITDKDGRILRYEKVLKR